METAKVVLVVDLPYICISLSDLLENSLEVFLDLAWMIRTIVTYKQTVITIVIC